MPGVPVTLEVGSVFKTDRSNQCQNEANNTRETWIMNKHRMSPKLLICLGWVALIFVSLASRTPAQEPLGHLVIMGGGGTPPAVVHQAIRLAGGNDAKIILVAAASSRQKAGRELQQFFKSLGATNPTILNVAEESAALSQLNDADLIWMGGGSQNRLVNRLPVAVKQRIKKLYLGGCVVGGTSAGAAAMSSKMITGNANLKSVRAQSTELSAGLELTDLIVDQHFHKRQRFNRLLSAVLDHPQQLGIGIDEQTAVILSHANLKVVGESSVLVLDAREAELKKPELEQGLQTATGVKLHVIAAGQSLSLTTLKLENDSPEK